MPFMKLLSQIMILLIGVLFVACSKKSSSPSDSLAGTWIFTNQLTQSSVPVSTSLIGSSPSVTTSWTAPADSIKITFDGNGSYTFLNFHLPIDRGTYTILKDSFLVIHPDTADFVKFNYTLPVIGFSGTVTTPTSPTTTPLLPTYVPYTNFHFVSDTILFRKATDNSKLTFIGTWRTTQAAPANDTIVLNQCTNFFIRQ